MTSHFNLFTYLTDYSTEWGSHSVKLPVGADQDPVKSLTLLSQQGNYTGHVNGSKGVEVFQKHYNYTPLIPPLQKKNSEQLMGVSAYIHGVLEYVCVYTSHELYMCRVS